MFKVEGVIICNGTVISQVTFFRERKIVNDFELISAE